MNRPENKQINEVLWTLPMNTSPIGSVVGSNGSVTYGKSPDGRDCLICTPGNSGNTIAFINKELTHNLPVGKMTVLEFTFMGVGLVSAQPVCYMTYSSNTFGQDETQVIYSLTSADANGTYSWRSRNNIFRLNSDTTNLQLKVGIGGMAGSSGTVYITNVCVKNADMYDLHRPEIDNSYNQTPTALRGFQLAGVPSRTDFFHLKDVYNTNLVRVCIYNTNQDYPQLTNTQDLTSFTNWFNGRINEIDDYLIWAKQNGQKVIINLGRTPGMTEDPNITVGYVLNHVYYDMFIDCWKIMASRWKGNDTILGFDIINEPTYLNQLPQTPPEAMNIYTGIVNAVSAVREIDPDRTVICEIFGGFTHPMYAKYTQPIPFDNVIYSFHLYSPGSVYNLSQTNTNVYPGFQLKNQGVEMSYGRKYFSDPGLVIDKEYLRDQIKPIRDFQLAYKVPIYVGEFGTMRWAPGANIWLKDACELFDEYGWIYTQFEFNDGSFSVEYASAPVGGGGTKVGPITDRAISMINALSANANPFSSSQLSAFSINVTDISTSSVNVTWDIGNNSIDNIIVSHKQTSGSVWTSASANRDVQSKPITNLVPGVSYDYRVTITSTSASIYSSKTQTKTSSPVRFLSTVTSGTRQSVLGGWGMRILSDSYTGPILTVRRSSDNTTLNISAVPNGEYLNVSAVSAFCGAGNGYVTQWFDTTGKGKHAIQPVSARQFMIMSAGTLVTSNNMAGLLDSGGQAVYVSSSINAKSSSACIFMGVAKQLSGNSGLTTICGEFSTSGGQMYWLVTGQTPGPISEVKLYERNDQAVVFLANVASLTTVSGFPLNSVSQFVVRDSKNRVKLSSKYVNYPINDTSHAYYGTFTFERFSIGARDRAGLGYDYGVNAIFHELVLFGSDMSLADESNLRENQLEFYKVP